MCCFCRFIKLFFWKKWNVKQWVKLRKLYTKSSDFLSFMTLITVGFIHFLWEHFPPKAEIFCYKNISNLGIIWINNNFKKTITKCNFAISLNKTKQNMIVIKKILNYFFSEFCVNKMNTIFGKYCTLYYRKDISAKLGDMTILNKNSFL